jgi:hypothetical protein
LPIPKVFKDHADWQNDQVKHCAVAIWQGINGDGARKKESGKHYLYSVAFNSARLDPAVSGPEALPDAVGRTRHIFMTKINISIMIQKTIIFFYSECDKLLTRDQ